MESCPPRKVSELPAPPPFNVDLERAILRRPAPPDRLSTRQRPPLAAIDDFLRVLFLQALDGLAELLEVPSMAGEEEPTAFADFIDQGVGEFVFFSGHVDSSSQSISGVTICGVRSPNLRLIVKR